jgi:hypothetical protein
MRLLLPLLLLVTGCASEMKGKWPSLAPRPGEVTVDGQAATGGCATCGQDVVVAPPPPPAARPLPADVDSRLAATAGVVAGIESRAPAQQRTAAAAIAAARGNPDRAGDAEVERSRFEALFQPLSIEERRLDVLADDIEGRDGAEAVTLRMAALRDRIAVLQAMRGSLPD